MIKQLQKRFVAIAMLSLFIVLVLVLAVVNGINLYNLNQRADSVIDVLAANNGSFPENAHESGGPGGKKLGLNITEETPFETRYFSVITSSEKDILSIDTGHIASVTSDTAADYAEEVLEGFSERGFIDQFRYRIIPLDDGYLVIFVNMHSAIQTAQQFLLTSIAVAGVSLAVLFILVSLLSRRAVQPFVENVERQKRFITDAAHELRTPLAIISSDNDVIEMTGRKSEWTESIRTQIRRMDGLIKDLILMSRMEETRERPHFAKTDISRIADEKVRDRRGAAEKKNVSLTAVVEPNITCMGDEKNLERLVDILLDNAVKYVDEGGKIALTLRQEGKKVRLAIENTCENMPEGDLRRLFDRFYRADEARTHKTGSKGGYGIGLSMADAIIRQHRGKIHAERVAPGHSETGRPEEQTAPRIRFVFEIPA